MRDATFTLTALMNGGFYEESLAWRRWLLNAVAGTPSQLNIMYGLAGERRLDELELEWLPGYEGSRPVRIGNAAYKQSQLDVFGEVMDALHLARRSGGPIEEDAWRVQLAMLKHLESAWREPDNGIWEIRGAPRTLPIPRSWRGRRWTGGFGPSSDSGFPAPSISGALRGDRR